MRVAKNWKKGFFFLKRGSFYANNYRKDHSTEELRRWIRVGDYKRRKIGWIQVTKSLVTSYQLPVTRRISIRQMNKDIKKGEKEDTCLIHWIKDFIPIDNVSSFYK